MNRLQGRRALITGAASGIGRASARIFAEEGARVLAVDRSPAVQEVVDEIDRAGGTAAARVADAGDEDAVAACVSECVERWGGIDVLYANAGITGPSEPLFEQRPEDWEQLLRVNLLGPFLAIRHAGPQMVQAGRGAIVCTASVAGLRANAGGVAYSASKAGVISLVQTTANQLTGTGVRINAVCPGLIETGMTRPVFDRARERGTADRIGQLNPTRRAGQPEEIARMALFLASDEASYVNGQAFAVDGGLSSTHPFTRPRQG